MQDRVVGVAAACATALIALMRYFEARHEPYHIDELRQARSYDQPLHDQGNASFSQEQPPLDVLIGAQLQDFLGCGDINNRMPSMLAGIGVAMILIVLLWRNRVRAGVPVTIIVLALTPAFLSLTAYARPYALPLLLILWHAAMWDSWLRNGSRIAAFGPRLRCAVASAESRVRTARLLDFGHDVRLSPLVAARMGRSGVVDCRLDGGCDVGSRASGLPTPPGAVDRLPG